MKNLGLVLLTVFLLGTSFYSFTASENDEPLLLKKKDTAVISENFTETGIAKTASASDLLYTSLDFTENRLNKNVFDKAFAGFENLKKAGKLNPDSHLLTICDFSLSSNTKRLWVIDMKEQKVLFNSLVAHGKNTGEEFAEHFSNTESSYQSSLGFYITETTYNGDNGFSLRLHGMDKGFNDNALQRAIVMHGADYVSDDFAKQHKRVGRSWGCPAVPRNLAEPIINTIKENNVLFIYYPDETYLKSSEWLKS